MKRRNKFIINAKVGYRFHEFSGRVSKHPTVEALIENVVLGEFFNISEVERTSRNLPFSCKKVGFGNFEIIGHIDTMFGREPSTLKVNEELLKGQVLKLKEEICSPGSRLSIQLPVFKVGVVNGKRLDMNSKSMFHREYINKNKGIKQ